MKLKNFIIINKDLINKMKREPNYYRIRKMRDSAYELCDMCDNMLKLYNTNKLDDEAVATFCHDILSLHKSFRQKLTQVCKPHKQYTISDEERKRRSENMKLQRTKRSFHIDNENTDNR